MKIFTDEGAKRIDIISSFREHYNEGAMSQSKVYSWITEIERDNRSQHDSESWDSA
jgi:hypothetical protein